MSYRGSKGFAKDKAKAGSVSSGKGFRGIEYIGRGNANRSAVDSSVKGDYANPSNKEKA